jgi:hypothetical protein
MSEAKRAAGVLLRLAGAAVVFTVIVATAVWVTGGWPL